MHLAIDARLYSPSFGIGRYVFEITKQLFKICPEWKISIFLGEKEFHDFIPPSSNIKKILAPEKIYSLGEQTSFLKKLYKTNADITWFPHFTVPFFFNKPFVVTVHDLTISKYPGKKMNSWIHRFVYFKTLRHALSASKHILTVSQNTKLDIITDEHINSEKITIGYNAVGKEFTQYILPKNSNERLEKLGIQNPFFLYTGVHREHKNILGMVQGFAEYSKKTNGPEHLVITGAKDEKYTDFIDYAKQHQIEDKIHLVGKVSEEDLHLLYAKASIYIFPSFYEGFGIPPLEAMAVKTPVIASNSSCIPEICTNAAEYFDPKNPSQLAEKIELLMTNPQKKDEFIHNGLQRIQDFSWEKTAQIIKTTLENAVKK